MVARKPAVTVVIPTYNWSGVLRCAIRSVMLQTVQDFELLVVGDGCTDDTKSVVASFNDPRIRWHNLERNYGSQWMANNYANEHARADWIAYLGHDDIWYPTHLEAVLRTATRDKADVVTSTMILYWPEFDRRPLDCGIVCDRHVHAARLRSAIRLCAFARHVWRRCNMARIPRNPRCR